jgi:hypothetical protein
MGMKTAKTKQRVKPVCVYCGSDEVYADAYAAWDVESQKWELARDVFDKGSVCEVCRGETSYKWVECT